MDKYDLLEAMSGIRDDYIEEAAADLTRTGTEETLTAAEAEMVRSAREAVSKTATAAAGTDRDAAGKGQAPSDNSRDRAAARARRGRFRAPQRWAAAAAALLCVSVLIPNLLPGASSALRGVPLIGDYFRTVTFRAPKSGQTDQTEASGETETAVTEEKAESSAGPVSDGDEPVSADADQGGYAANSGALSMQDFDVQEYDESDPSACEEALAGEEEDLYEEEGTTAEEADQSLREAAAGADLDPALLDRAAEDIARYEKCVEEEVAYDSLRFQHQIVTDSDDWFCVSVRAFTSIADGYDETAHFNMDKKTGEWVSLPDLFPEGTDYVTPVTDNIREQMRALTAEDPENEFWLDGGDEPGELFTSISADQDYYLNDSGELVIFFNEMEAAPLYMGTLEFTIPAEVTSGAGMR